MKSTVHIQCSSSNLEDTIIIKVDDLGFEDEYFVRDAKILARVIIEKLPGATYYELLRFIKAYEHTKNGLHKDENFERYWKNRGTK